jgi:hypothetical protein
MKALRRVAVIAILVSVFPPARATEVASKQFAARTELRPIQTLTLSDQQVLTGDSTGKPTTIVGSLASHKAPGVCRKLFICPTNFGLDIPPKASTMN